MNGSITIQQPEGPAQQLFLLFHGYGATPQGLVPLGQRLGAAFPHSLVVSVQAPHACDLGRGFQWFSAQGITEENRLDRITKAMPAFSDCVAHWQKHSKLDAARTALIGFSQGAIMALASTQSPPMQAGRVVALAGRFAVLPDAVPPECTLHFIHGKQDAVIPYGFTIEAAERLVALGCDITADVLPFVGHEVNAEVESLVLNRLQTHLPKRYWDAAEKAQAAETLQVTTSTPLSRG